MIITREPKRYMVDWPLILTTKECIFCWCQDSPHHHHPVGFKHSSCYAIEAGANTDHVKVDTYLEKKEAQI